MSKRYLAGARAAIALVTMCCVVGLSGCTGTKTLKEPVQLNLEKPIVTTSDQSITASLAWIITRDGPGSWAKNVEWDEYLITVTNNTGDKVQVTDVVVVDSLGLEQKTDPDWQKLRSGSRRTIRRYAENDIQVEAGRGSGDLVMAAASGAIASAAVSAGVAATVGGTGALTTAIAAGGVTAGAAVGGCLAAPVCIGIGAVRAYASDKVGREIRARQTQLPHLLIPGSHVSLDLFFPLAPSPSEIRVSYERASAPKVLSMDVSGPLTGLHLIHKGGD